MRTITPIDKAGLQRMTNEEIWRLRCACFEAISAMRRELEQHAALPPMVKLEAKAGQCVHTRRHRA
jgi:hypothetical protein